MCNKAATLTVVLASLQAMMTTVCSDGHDDDADVYDVCVRVDPWRRIRFISLKNQPESSY